MEEFFSLSEILLFRVYSFMKDFFYSRVCVCVGCCSHGTGCCKDGDYEEVVAARGKAAIGAQDCLGYVSCVEGVLWVVGCVIIVAYACGSELCC